MTKLIDYSIWAAETRRVAPKLGVAPVQREKIVQATIRCLARDGASGLRTKQIAHEAGVSQGILHYYFAGKRAILVAALETVMTDLDHRLARLLREAPDARARLRAVIRGALGLADENRRFWIVFVEFWGEMMHDQELLRFNAALYQQFRRKLAALVTQGIREGLFRRLEPEAAGAVILALIDGVSLQRTFDPKAFTLDQATRFCEDAIIRYLETRREERPERIRRLRKVRRAGTR